MTSFKKQSNRPSRRDGGFSLVELLVSMVIALIIMAGVLQSFLASRTSFEFNEELAFIQDNARYATSFLTRELRAAGYFGCDMNNAVMTNSIAGNYNGLLTTGGLEGFEGGVSPTNANFPALYRGQIWGNTDSVIIRRADEDNSFVVQSHNPSSATIQIVGTHAFTPGTVFAIADANCSSVGMFAMSGPTNNNANAQQVVHNKGNAATENCTKSVKGTGNAGTDSDNSGAYDCGDNCGTNTCDWSAGSGYGPDSKLLAMSAKAFYISGSTADPTMPALFMQRLTGGGNIAREELVAGVEDFQLEYGFSNTGLPPANRFVSADNLNPADWADVVAVRVNMLARSENPVLEQNEPRTYLGVNYNDRFLRQLITTTVLIRN